MNTAESIKHVELSLTEAKKIASLGEAIKRLEANKDFKRLVFDEYFTAEAQRLTFLTADTNLEEKLANAVWSDIRAIGAFRAFIMNRKLMGDMAQKEIKDFNETLDELRAEEADEGEE